MLAATELTMRNHLGPIIPDDYDPYYIQDWPPQPAPIPRARLLSPLGRFFAWVIAGSVLAAIFAWLPR